jgi:hypothetical protein
VGHQVGFTTTKLFADRFTYVLETSYIGFTEYEYDDGTKVQFGEEYRLNNAFVLKLPTWTDLNENEFQQGAEGKENYRAIVTLSVLL